MDGTRQAGGNWLMDRYRTGAAMMGNAGMVRLTVSPLALFALTVSHLIGSALALVNDLAVSVES